MTGIVRRVLPLALAAAGLVHAQSALVTRGAEIYKVTCGVAYCHGPAGTAGRAPQLAGRGFSAQDIFGTVLSGKPGTAMPSFADQLKSDEIEAVTQYILSLPAPAGAAAAPRASAVLIPPEVRKGHDLFFDAVRMSGCGKCHELQDRGSAVGPDLKSLMPAQLTDLRSASHTRAVTVSPEGEEPFPGIVAEPSPGHVRVYDLSAALPVLRTFPAAQVRIMPGSPWSHAAAVENYQDAELVTIGAYLRWVAATLPAKK